MEKCNAFSRSIFFYSKHELYQQGLAAGYCSMYMTTYRVRGLTYLLLIYIDAYTSILFSFGQYCWILVPQLRTYRAYYFADFECYIHTVSKQGLMNLLTSNISSRLDCSGCLPISLKCCFRRDSNCIRKILTNRNSFASFRRFSNRA